ncbi:MAG TPA: HAMP domain-containing sensor histidine kinase [Coriobacteriia bacterium]|nr:HAMP domain-containing sensor histidine kinase [Coriobacteriia bacterium]
MPLNSEAPDNLTKEDVAVVAHEVRGALTVISGFSELLRRELSEEDRKAALDGISRAVRRIDRLVDSFMIGARHARTPGQRISLVELAESVAAEQRAITGRQVVLTVVDRPEVSGVPDALERALGNLIDNALKYSLRNSGVDIEVGTENGFGVLAVADRGPGIPEDEREQVLQPFERLGRTDVPGTGLGLAVVNGVAEAHGGRVEIRERDGGGTVVRLLLPLAP